jgi:hypothetical protein
MLSNIAGLTCAYPQIASLAASEPNHVLLFFVAWVIKDIGVRTLHNISVEDCPKGQRIKVKQYFLAIPHKFAGG